MSSTKRYLSFQTRVLIPVVSLLTIAFIITLLVVNRRLTARFEDQARQNLSTANTVFLNSLDIRARSLVLQYQNVVNEPRFKAVAQLGEPNTLNVLLDEMLDEMGGDAEVLLFTGVNGRLVAGAKKDPLLSIHDFTNVRSNSFREALDGQHTAQIVAARDRLYNLISVPVLISKNLIGVLSVGVRMDKTAAQELKSLTGNELAFIMNDNTVVSTLHDTQLEKDLVRVFRQMMAPATDDSVDENQIISSRGEHFLCLARLFSTTDGNSKIGYLLLSSYEKALQAKQGIQRMLILISAVGILFSSLLITVLIRKMTRPLLQLRDTAEAVGHGDFSKRVEIDSKDEVGDLANVFNRMTENLTAARAETEHALNRLRTTQAQLIQTEKLSAIGEFVSGVAHELNNPLTALIGFSEVLRVSGIGERQEGFVDKIIESAERCHKIVHGLLSFARQHPPERKWVHIHSVIEAAVEILSYELRNSSIRVVTNFPSEFPRLLVDPHQLQQVFLNLINNARQAIEDHQSSGEIRISLERRDNVARIVFQDNGPGIPRENLRRIFDPFFTTKPVGVGTGLGLSRSYGIIREHNGTITAHSEPGEGTTFVIELPAAEVEPDLQLKLDNTSARVLAKEGVGKKILIIDDEQPILELLKAALTVRGYHVETAQDGMQGLHHAQQNRYDAIVCDWKMPGVNGQQVYEKLLESKPEAIARLIFMTGDILSIKAEQFLQQQKRICLFKPFSIEQFHETLKKTLSSPPSV
jgi:signal transduction histidine kinase